MHMFGTTQRLLRGLPARAITGHCPSPCAGLAGGMAEHDFIAQLRRFADDKAARGLADDAAVLGDLVLTHDMIVIGTHVLPGCAPEDVAWKLVGVNLSDLAAKGATPVGVLYGHMLGDTAWDTRFAAALEQALAHFATPLLGGDTVGAAAGSRSFGMTAIGRASHQPVPSRAGAQPGDTLWLTGCIGAAYAGFLADSGQWAGAPAAGAEAITRYRRPEPRLAAGLALAPQVTAMMDVSDGLLLDASRLAQASGVTISIDRAAVPLATCIAGNAVLAERALRWGDDYELLFTLPATVQPPVAATPIGSVLPATASPLLIDGMPPEPGIAMGFTHQGN